MRGEPAVFGEIRGFGAQFAPVPSGGGRHVGSVRFEHPGPVRHLGEMSADAAAPFVGRGASESQSEAEREEGLAFDVGAVEGVDDARDAAAAPQILEHPGGGLSHVHGHRQCKLRGEV